MAGEYLRLLETRAIFANEQSDRDDNFDTGGASTVEAVVNVLVAGGAGNVSTAGQVWPSPVNSGPWRDD